MSLEALLQTLGVQQPAPQPAPVPMQSRPAFDRYQSYAQPMQPQRPTLPRPPGSYLGGGGTPSPQTPPPGFTSGQWAQLLNLSKVNPAIKDLIDKYTQGAGGGTPGTPKPPADPWRREMPTDTSQLMRQLSFNAGEMGMPGGYVGAVQIPAYGSTQPPVNNPDMTTYGQQPGIGEATYYMQSMNGGMAPIAAMSPLGVPAGWNPGGGGKLGYGQRMRLANSGMLGGAGTFQPKSFQQTTEDLAESMSRMGSGVGPDPISLFNAAFAPESNKSSSSSSMQKKKKTGSGSGNGGKPPKGNSGGGSSYKPPSKGVPISLPFGY